MLKLFSLSVLFLLYSCGGNGAQNSSVQKTTPTSPKKEVTQIVTPQIKAQYPHPTDSYTQGLLIHKGKMYESTGNYGQSKLRVIDIKSGKVEKEISLPSNLFGEGLALYNNKLYQLTWHEGICRVYDLNLKLLETLSYRGEGWGLVAHNDELYMSDGSAIIQVRDPKTFRILRQFEVHDNGSSVTLLNELEMIDGLLYANIYMSPMVAVIDPTSGNVLRYIDGTSLHHRLKNPQGVDVFNGIAYDSVSKKIYMTGKLWESTFEVVF